MKEKSAFLFFLINIDPCGNSRFVILKSYFLNDKIKSDRGYGSKSLVK